MRSILWASWVIVILSSCSTVAEPRASAWDALEHRRFGYAVYDQHNQLIHSPIERFQEELESRPAGEAFSDVYVVSYGWNYTADEGFALYESYRLSVLEKLAELRGSDPSYRPYFIFVIWGSVTRPMTEAVRSTLPWSTAGHVESATGLLDTILFHVPSNWGETQDAFEIAIGGPERALYRSEFRGTQRSEYEWLRMEGRQTARSSTSAAYSIPLSVVLDELIRLNADESGAPRYRLHTVGHSFGAKVVSLATLDACARRELDRSLGIDPKMSDTDIDSLVLLLPAMQPSEMYSPVSVLESDVDRLPVGDRRLVSPEWMGLASIVVERGDRIVQGSRSVLDFRRVARRVGRKILVHSHQDTANGWVFGASQLLLNNDAVTEMNTSFHSYGLRYIEPVPLVLRGVYSIGWTLGADVWGTLMAPVNAAFDVWASENGEERVWNVLAFPFSPLLVHRATGNRGLPRVLPATRWVVLANSWYAEENIRYLNDSFREGSDRFEKLARTPLDALPASLTGRIDSGKYVTFDAKTVYDGHGVWGGPYFGGLVNVIFPPGAHSDVRLRESWERSTTKREATLNFLYNVTRRRESPSSSRPMTRKDRPRRSTYLEPSDE